MKFSWDFPGIFRSRKSGMEFSIYLHSRSRKWEWNLPFTFTFPFPKMGMEIAISRSRSRSPKVIPAHGCCTAQLHTSHCTPQLHSIAEHQQLQHPFSKDQVDSIPCQSTDGAFKLTLCSWWRIYFQFLSKY